MSAPYALHCGDCREVMATMEAESIDAIVSDPPYGLGFMGRAWDHGVPGVPFWTEALRVAKPGAHLVAFGGSRTFHRLVCAVEDAEWEIRDVLMWLYGSGFPKSLDVSKAIDKEAGAEREVVGTKLGLPGYHLSGHEGGEAFGRGLSSSTPQSRLAAATLTAPATDAARQWSGWGTALKPAYEPIILARKPLRGTVARNVQTYGTGAVNVDGCRVGSEQTVTRRNGDSGGNGAFGRDERVFERVNPPGRWPANVLLDEAAAAVLDTMAPSTGASAPVRGDEASKASVGRVTGERERVPGAFHGDRGGASRFFYTSKASAKDRGREEHGNNHPTVKPTDLMRWLCRLVTPPGGLILDPFMGSGSTGVAAVAEGFRFVGVDIERHHVEIAERRLAGAAGQPSLFEAAVVEGG